MFAPLRLHQRLTRNTLIKFSSELVGRAASFLLVLWAARQLGEAGFGLYNYGLALGFVLAQLADLGLQVLISREVAVHSMAARPLAGVALQLKLGLSLLVLALLLVLTAGEAGNTRFVLIVLGMAQLAQTFLEFAAYIFRGQQRLWTEAWLLGSARLLTAVLGILLLWLGGDVPGLALGSLAAVTLLLFVAYGKLGRAGWLASLEQRFSFHEYHLLLRETLPLGIAIFLSIAYTRLAILLLQAEAGEVAVAQYSAAFRLVEPTQIIPASLLAAVFPVFSHAWQYDRPAARRMGVQVTLMLATLGGAVALTFWLAAGWLVPLLYGEGFSGSVEVLQILALSVIFTFVNYSLTHYLIARRQQRYIGFLTAGMLGFHALLSWMLIPRLGAVGPAISVILAEGLLFVGCLLALTFSKVPEHS